MTRLNFRRYKEGFDRLGFVVFVVVAILFTAVYFSVDAPFVVPEPDSEAGLALAREIKLACSTSANQVLGTLCEESALTARRWEHFRQQYATGNAASWMVWLGALLALGFAGARLGWVIAGFHLRHGEAITLKQKIKRLFEDSFLDGPK